MDNSTLGLVLHAGIVVKAVLLLLFMFSVISWAIIIYKWLHFSKARTENAAFLANYNSTTDSEALYQASTNSPAGPIAKLYKTSFPDASKGRERVKNTMKRYITLETAKLERYLNFLATTGSATPFVGLFGTVWGIMDAFRDIGITGSASLAVVAPGIAEALITTAAGLAAAIPAVIGYNYYLSMSRRFIIEMEDFAEEFLDYYSEKKHEN
jgi:biopolymer transport protein TolQ